MQRHGVCTNAHIYSVVFLNVCAFLLNSLKRIRFFLLRAGGPRGLRPVPAREGVACSVSAVHTEWWMVDDRCQASGNLAHLMPNSIQTEAHLSTEKVQDIAQYDIQFPYLQYIERRQAGT